MRNFTLTYPITVYSVDTDYSTGAVKAHTFTEPPTNYDAHLIKFNKLIWLRGTKDSFIYYLKKKDAKKAGLAITRARIKLLNKQVAELKKILKETKGL